MNSNIQSRLTESVGTKNISYIMNKNTDFSVTGYKVMQNHSFTGLVRCAKILYNGHIKLVYLVEDKKPLSLVVSRFGINELCTVMANLLQKVNDIKANGFFIAENLELSYDKIFVDTTDYSVHLLYYPLTASDTGKIYSFESVVRVAFMKLFADFPVFSAACFRQLVNELTKTALPLDVVTNNFKSYIKTLPSDNAHLFEGEAEKTTGVDIYRNERAYGAVDSRPAAQPPLTISGINSSFRMVVSQPDFIIGKNPSMVHGCISDNAAISRVHCRIIYNDGKYFLKDEGSANGTFVNGKRLNKSEREELKDGDTVLLANSSFKISF